MSYQVQYRVGSQVWAPIAHVLFTQPAAMRIAVARHEFYPHVEYRAVPTAAPEFIPEWSN